MKRAIRRHHKFRKRQRARRVMQLLLGEYFDQEYADKNADHLKKCSCWMCGNQRKWLGKTRAEQQDPTDLWY